MNYTPPSRNIVKNTSFICYSKNLPIFKENAEDILATIIKKVEVIFSNCHQYDLKTFDANDPLIIVYDSLLNQININYSFEDEEIKYNAKCHIFKYLCCAYLLFIDIIKNETLIKINQLIKIIFPLNLHKKLLEEWTRAATERNVCRSHIETLTLNLSEIDNLIVEYDKSIEYLKAGKLNLFYKTVGDILYINPNCKEALLKKIYINLHSRLVLDEYNLYRYEVVLQDITYYLKIDPFCEWMLDMRSIIMAQLLIKKVSHAYNLDNLAKLIISDSNRTLNTNTGIIKIFSHTVILLWSRVKAYELLNDIENKDRNLMLIEDIITSYTNLTFLNNFKSSILIYYDLGILKLNQKNYLESKKYFQRILEMKFDHKEAADYVNQIDTIMKSKEESIDLSGSLT